MSAIVERSTPGQLRVVGRVDFENANELTAQGERLIESEGHDVCVDLAGLTASGSVAIAVLLAWFRHATLLDKEIRFANMPAELLNVIDFSGLEDIVPLEDAPTPAVRSE